MTDIKDKIKQIGIDITDLQVEQLNIYYQMLVEKNKVVNLTAITDYDEVVTKHFIDSAAIVSCIDFNSIESLIDVGTGAGFPGLVLKILFPGINVTLLDSLNKRIAFLNDVITELKLEKIVAVHNRAEDAAHNDNYREKYDIAVARAVTNLSSLSEYCLPFVKIGGSFISYKSCDCEEEVINSKNAIRILGGDSPEINRIVLPDTNIERAFVCISKNKTTPKKFPRKAGVPTKTPIV